MNCSAFLHGRGGQGIFRPGVLGVAPLQFLADDFVGIGPETGEVIRDLLRPKIGGKQMQQHGDATAGNPRRRPPGKNLLNADRQDRGFARSVFQLDPTSTGNLNPLWSLLVDQLELLRRIVTAKPIEPRCGLQFGETPPAAAKFLKHLTE